MYVENFFNVDDFNIGFILILIIIVINDSINLEVFLIGDGNYNE